MKFANTTTACLLMACAILAAPALADGPAPGGELAGTAWRLIELDGNKVDGTVNSTLNISADGVGGNGGCNTFGGTLTLTPGGIDISQVTSTMMACDGLQQEQAYFAALEAATAYRIENGDLVLTGAGTDTDTLARLAQSD